MKAFASFAAATAAAAASDNTNSRTEITGMSGYTHGYSWFDSSTTRHINTIYPQQVRESLVTRGTAAAAAAAAVASSHLLVIPTGVAFLTPQFAAD